jgi:hypothetical protein
MYFLIKMRVAALSPLLSSFSLGYAIGRCEEPRRHWNRMGHISFSSVLMKPIYWSVI